MRIGDRGVAVGHAKEGKNRIMNNRHCLTALVTIGALLGAAGSAAADPYADETVSVERRAGAALPSESEMTNF